MEPRDFAGQALPATTLEEKLQASGAIAAAHPVSSLSGGRAPNVFVFNPFAEGFIARGKGFAPVKHQTLLAGDLASLPQFLCRPDDVVLLEKRPSVEFLRGLKQAGFPAPEFVELKRGRISARSSFLQRKIGTLRPWAWGPDSVQLFEPIFRRGTGEARGADECFNAGIARLYSKAWSAALLRNVLTQCREVEHAAAPATAGPWLCTEAEAGVAVDTLEAALEAIAAIRRRGHHRVVVKEAHGLAGHNAIRLWEPEVLPTQRQWLAKAARNRRQLVVEPWLERELDFSVQLEMGPRKLNVCGYTGLVNDPKGQFLANWAAANYDRCLPADVAALFPTHDDMAGRLERLYGGIMASLEAELKRAGFIGPVSIDAFVYRTPGGDCRLKPIVEINPRYTMGRLAVELMRHACAGSRGLLRLASRAQARAEGFDEFAGYARSLGERLPLRLEGEPVARIREGAVCLNDPATAQVCLATFEVTPVRKP
jgi:hypothetical protein